MRSRFCLGAMAVGLAILAGCSQGSQLKNVDDPPIPTAEADGSAAAEEDSYLVQFETSAGNFTVRVHPSWAPRGAARFRELVEEGFYDECRFFRVIPSFMVQFGINGDPAVHAKWDKANIPDDPPLQPNKRGYVTFANAGPNTRSTQVFINYVDNPHLDHSTFAPFGEVIEGMDAVEAINSESGERPDQTRIGEEGNAYLEEAFPNLDYVKKARVVSSEG